MFKLFKNFFNEEDQNLPEQTISEPEQKPDPEDSWYAVKSMSGIVEKFFAADLCWDYELNVEVSLSNKISIILNRPDVTLIRNLALDKVIVKTGDSLEEFDSEEEIEKKYKVGSLIMKKDAVNQIIVKGSKDMVMKFVDFYNNLQTKETETC